ncbi:MAG: phosphate signaling complex protein PhoU [Devosia nanyangense]|uniref:Phosphate-specific transport system accessory protein PhoU n=1 Tax=Devosia nanyangense TaxID=1228055 RepID=A0A933NYK1_9HYPH|nr:phosphate signaling complex protein PhoU [Devosia nanyangense]
MPTSHNEHIVTSYEDELTALAASISEMGGQVEAAVADATRALLKLDHAAAKQIIAHDKQIDEMHRTIDDMAVSMIARRQPMARDLRAIITSIHVAGDLERVGDMAKTISRRTLQIEGLSLTPKFYNGVKHMSDLILRQLKAALDAYATRDATAAVEVCNADDEIDALYTSLFRELLTYMMEDPRNITQCTHLLFCSKSLERVGDHATNIAEAAFYLDTGRQMSESAGDLHRIQIKE